jgi:hypothetical protein
LEQNHKKKTKKNRTKQSNTTQKEKAKEEKGDKVLRSRIGQEFCSTAVRAGRE